MLRRATHFCVCWSLLTACSGESETPGTTSAGGSEARGGTGGGNPVGAGGGTALGGSSLTSGGAGVATGGTSAASGGATSGGNGNGSLGGNTSSNAGGGASSGAGGSANNGGTTGTTSGGVAGMTSTGGAGGSLPEPTRVVIGGPIVRVDFDMQGRPTGETTEIGYNAWPIATGASATSTFSGVKFTIAKAGSNGSGIKTDWQKLAVQTPNYARLVGDGVTVDGGEAGGQIQLTIGGLSAGKHSILAYLNQTAGVASVAPIDISVDGSPKLTNVTPSIQALSNAAAKTAYISFDAQAGKDVVLLFKAQTSSSAANKNVMINGFDLNVPNPAEQAQNPTPPHGDEHVDCDAGNVTLSWKAASNAASHDVYVSNDLATLESATRSSPAFKGNQTATSFKLSGIDSLKTYYWRVDELTSGNVATSGATWYFRPRHLAFPAAEGYGRFARGGRGGVVVHVTNLNDSGAGSLRDAVETERGPRTIVFDVGGIIKLASRLTINDNYVTVAGQTAPGKGIVVRAAPFGSAGAHDVIIQNVRVRLGAGTTYDGMGLTGCEHSIVDHCSISWTIDEGFSSRNGRNITLQRTMISECLNAADHTNSSGEVNQRHGYAGSISGDIGSFHHNLLAHCEGRNWSMAGGLDGAGNFAGRLDLFSTVIYNWGGRTNDGGAHEVNFVNNYYKPGAATHIFTALNLSWDNFPGTQRYYMAGNVMPGYFDESNQTKGLHMASPPTAYNPLVDKPFFPSYATIQSAKESYKDVLSDVGMTQPVFDDHDVRIVKETLGGTYAYKGSVTGFPGLPDSEADVGGYESYPTTNREASWDSDGDGLPDWWEKQIKSNPSSTKGSFEDANADPNADGYTQLDDYLIWMSKPHYFTTPAGSVSIDLSKVFAGYTSSPTYSSAAATNGSVTLSGKTATFKPAACGFGSWKLAVKDSEGSTKTVDMVAFADPGSASCP